MPIIKMTPADILKGKLLDAGWYSAKIVKVEDWTPSKDKGSLNLPVTFEIEGSGGKEITHTFNNKAIGMVAPLIAAIRSVKELKPEQLEFDTVELLGKKVDVNIIQDTYNGMLNNKIAGYLPSGKGKAAQTY